MNKYLFLVMMTMSKSLSLLAVFLYTKYLDIDEISKWSDVVSLYFLFFPIISLQMQTGIFRYSIKYKYLVIPIVNLSVILYFISIILVIISFSFSFRFNYIYSIILCLSAITFQFHLEYIRATIKENLYYYLSFSSVLLSFVFSIILLFFFDDFKSIIYGEFFGTSIVLSYAFYILHKKGKKTFRIKIKRDILNVILKYSLPLIPNAIAWWLITTGAISISNILIGGNSAGIVNINLKASLIVSSLGFILSTIMQRTLIEQYELSFMKYKESFIVKIKKMILLLLIVAIISNVSFYFILSNFYQEYYKGNTIIIFSSISGFLYSLSSILGVMYICQKRTKLALKSITISSISSVLLMYILSDNFGVYGVFLSLMIGFIINIIIRFFDFKYLVLNER